MKVIQTNLPELHLFHEFMLFLSELLTFPCKCDRGGEKCCPAAIQSHLENKESNVVVTKEK